MFFPRGIVGMCPGLGAGNGLKSPPLRGNPKRLDALAFHPFGTAFGGGMFRDFPWLSVAFSHAGTSINPVITRGKARPIALRAAPIRTTCRGGMLSLEVPCIAVGRRPDETICSDHVERDSGRFGR